MKQTAVEWYENKINALFDKYEDKEISKSEFLIMKHNLFYLAKEMEKEQIGYSKEDVLKAGEMGEINHHDTKHIVSYLDEAKQYNETFNTNEK